MSLWLDPPEPKSRLCDLCESAAAVDGQLCGPCAVRSLIDDHEIDLARSVAVTHGISHEAVERMIRDALEYRARLEVDATRAVLRAPAAANDNASVRMPAYQPSRTAVRG